MQDTQNVVSSENKILGKLARVLYTQRLTGKFDKDAWEAVRSEYRKEARGLIRALEKQGLTLDLAE